MGPEAFAEAGQFTPRELLRTIDTGLARVAGYDPERGLDKLEVKRISRASATQRAGRAGRTGPGVAVRLWSEREWERMPEFEASRLLAFGGDGLDADEVLEAAE